MVDFIDKSTTQSGTPVNRVTLLGIQGYQKEVVSFEADKIVRTNGENEVETTTFSDNKIIKEFVGKKTITQTITFTETGYTKELS